MHIFSVIRFCYFYVPNWLIVVVFRWFVSHSRIVWNWIPVLLRAHKIQRQTINSRNTTHRNTAVMKYSLLISWCISWIGIIVGDVRHLLWQRRILWNRNSCWIHYFIGTIINLPYTKVLKTKQEQNNQQHNTFIMLCEMLSTWNIYTMFLLH